MIASSGSCVTDEVFRPARLRSDPPQTAERQAPARRAVDKGARSLRPARPRPRSGRRGRGVAAGRLSAPPALAMNMLVPGGRAVADEIGELARGAERRHGLLVMSLLVAQRQGGHALRMDLVDLR